MNGWTQRCFTYFGLAYYSQGVIAALQAASGDVARTVAGETNLSSTLAQSIILAGLLLAVARAPGRYLPLCRPILPVLCIATLALLSVLWSGDPVRTLRRAVALTECVLFGMFLYRTDGLERTIGRVGQVCVAMAMLSILAYGAAPSIGRETALGYERAMRGVFPQKNSMSDCMLLGLCCYAYRLVEAPRWRHAGAVALLTLCLVLGRGASAVAVAVILFLVAVSMRLRGYPVLRLGFLFLVGWTAAVVTVAVIAFPQELFALAGRDASLTGRVPLWQALWPEIMLRPLIGHGYAGFWNADSATVQMIWRYAGWQAPDAHSSYLDILLQLGPWDWPSTFGRGSDYSPAPARRPGRVSGARASSCCMASRCCSSASTRARSRSRTHGPRCFRSPCSRWQGTRPCTGLRAPTHIVCHRKAIAERCGMSFAERPSVTGLQSGNTTWHDPHSSEGRP